MELYDTLAIEIGGAGRVRMLDTRLDKENAKAVMRFAIARRGVDREFYAVVPSGSYSDGDKWTGVSKEK